MNTGSANAVDLAYSRRQPPLVDVSACLTCYWPDGVFGNLSRIPDWARGASIVIGNFDGVHHGHQALFNRARDLAGNGPVAAFSPGTHPVRFFRPDMGPFLISPGDMKYHRLAEAGAEIVFSPDFDAKFMSIRAEDFVSNILIDGLGARHIVVGEGFRFGNGRKGDTALLKSLCVQADCRVSIVPPVKAGGVDCSSTLVRAFIRKGAMDQVADMLVQPWSLKPGSNDQLYMANGRQMLRLKEYGGLLPPEGKYSVTVTGGGVRIETWARLFLCHGGCRLELTGIPDLPALMREGMEIVFKSPRQPD